MGLKGYSAFLKEPALLEPHYMIVYCHIQGTHWEGLTTHQRCTRCILKPQSTGQYTELNIKTVLLLKTQVHNLNIESVQFYTIQFSINTQFKCKNSNLSKPPLSSIWPIDTTLSGATTSGQSEPGSVGNEVVLSIPQSSRNTGTSPWDYLVSYPGHSLGKSYLSVEIQLVHSTAPADWAN